MQTNLEFIFRSHLHDKINSKMIKYCINDTSMLIVNRYII